MQEAVFFQFQHAMAFPGSRRHLPNLLQMGSHLSDVNTGIGESIARRLSTSLNNSIASSVLLSPSKWLMNNLVSALIAVKV